MEFKTKEKKQTCLEVLPQSILPHLKEKMTELIKELL